MRANDLPIGLLTCHEADTRRPRTRSGAGGLPRLPTALTNGYPIATGMIGGACRYLVKDRMYFTGARWGLEGTPTATSTPAGRLTSTKNESVTTPHAISTA
jgi:hypothetical protein